MLHTPFQLDMFGVLVFTQNTKFSGKFGVLGNHIFKKVWCLASPNAQDNKKQTEAVCGTLDEQIYAVHT